MIDLQVRDRIRPWASKTYKLKIPDGPIVQFTLNHQQLWQVTAISEDKITLENSGYTMKLLLTEDQLTDLFNIHEVTRGRYYTDSKKKYM